MKTLIILNEQHKLMPSQEALLNERFDNWELLLVPKNGWDKIQQKEIARDIKNNIVVFASPIPYLLGLVVKGSTTTTFVLHNDKREKKELPNGKIISVVAAEGWELLEI